MTDDGSNDTLAVKQAISRVMTLQGQGRIYPFIPRMNRRMYRRIPVSISRQPLGLTVLPLRLCRCGQAWSKHDVEIETDI